MNKFGIGQPVRRVEDQRFITGRGRYVDDMNLPRQLYGALVMSTHAHARIKGIDASKAKAAPGVVEVLTHVEAAADKIGALPPVMPEDMGGPKGYRSMRPLLVGDKVRAVGDRVAFVVAETEEQARAAADLVEIDYEPLPVVVSIEDAVKPGAPAIWDECPSNVSFTLMFGNKDAVDAAFAKAKHVVSLKLDNNRINANAIEPRAAIGEYHEDEEGYTLYSTTQNPHGNRQLLARAVFNIPETKLRVVSPDVGGGFGMKAGGYPEEGLVLWAARRTGRPVKWTASRAESLMGDTHGRAQIIEGALAFDENGKILAVRAHALQAAGSHVVGACVATLAYSMRLVPGVYDIRALHVSTKAVFTNTAPLAPYRGAGRPEAAYFIERLMDKAAVQLGIDAIELRRRNYIKSEQMPYTTQTGYVYDSGDFARVTDECLKLSDWNGFAKRRAESKKNGKLRGRGLAYFLEEAAVFNERMELRFDPSGMVTIVAGTHSHGQGHATTYAQMVSDWLGVPFEAIRFVQGDTDAVPLGRGTYGSRSMVVGGSALKAAADAIIEKAKPMAAHLMEAAAADVEFKDGSFKIVGTDRAMPLTDVAKAFYRPMMLPKQFSVGLEASGSWTAEPGERAPSYPNGCHICELELDPDTGRIDIVKYTAVDDCGRVMNPLLCEGQMHGGVAQGLGQALKEVVIYDDSGQLVTGSFQDYAMPRAEDFPAIVSENVEIPAKTNLIGAKGAGEAGATGAPPAIILALLDAVRPLGIDHIDMPATPPRVWKALQEAGASAGAA